LAINLDNYIVENETILENQTTIENTTQTWHGVQTASPIRQNRVKVYSNKDGIQPKPNSYGRQL